MEGPIQLTPCSAGLAAEANPKGASIKEVSGELRGDVSGGDSGGDSGGSSGGRSGGVCRLQGECPVHDSISRLNDRIQGFLRELSLADLVQSKVDVPVQQVGRL